MGVCWKAGLNIHKFTSLSIFLMHSALEQMFTNSVMFLSCTAAPGRQWPGLSSYLSITKYFIESLARIYGQIHINFTNVCFCCMLATFVMIDTPVQGSTNFFRGRPESKYFSPLGVLWSVLQVLNSATGWWNEVQTILKTKGARLCASKT